MLESEFWAQLEIQICRELASLDDARRFLWCDGLVPDTFELSESPPYIEGAAWFGNSGQENWRFRLLLPQGYALHKDIQWSSLLPEEDKTWWLTVRQEDRLLIIAPLDAAPQTK